MNVSPKVLLVTPPFTQLNTPYPAMMYLKGFLNTKGVDSVQVDLSLEVILEIFSSRGLHELFQQVAAREIRLSGNARRIFALQEEYERMSRTLLDLRILFPTPGKSFRTGGRYGMGLRGDGVGG